MKTIDVPVFFLLQSRINCFHFGIESRFFERSFFLSVLTHVCSFISDFFHICTHFRYLGLRTVSGRAYTISFNFFVLFVIHCWKSERRSCVFFSSGAYSSSVFIIALAVYSVFPSIEMSSGDLFNVRLRENKNFKAFLPLIFERFRWVPSTFLNIALSVWSFRGIFAMIMNWSLNVFSNVLVSMSLSAIRWPIQVSDVGVPLVDNLKLKIQRMFHLQDESGAVQLATNDKLSTPRSYLVPYKNSLV